MAVAQVRIAEAEHEIVWAFDEGVLSPTECGWLPLVGGPHKGIDKTADRVKVRPLSVDQIAVIADTSDTPETGHLLACKMAIRAVNGKPSDTHGDYVNAWIDAAYRADRNIIRCLSHYLREYSDGGDPVTEWSARIWKAYQGTAGFCFGPCPSRPGGDDTDTDTGEE
ncbi:MAG: hypothetical protein ACI9MR_000012 [Myxococcota bacterium]|jgi:hypothetical protein